MIAAQAQVGFREFRLQPNGWCIDRQAAIETRIHGMKVRTTVGRVLLYEIIPSALSFELINKVMDKKSLGQLIDHCYRRCGQKATVLLADHLRTLGWTGDELGSFLFTEMESLLLDEPRLSADRLAALLAMRGKTLPNAQ